MRFAEKVILITGATSGLGGATAQQVASEGARVVLTAPALEAGEALAADIRSAGGEATFVIADLTVESEVAELVRQTVNLHGRLDGAFNNVVAPNAPIPSTEIDYRAWRAELALNLSGAFYSLKHQIHALAESGGGVIVNNASVSGVAGKKGTNNEATEQGVMALTRAVGLALDAASSGIRVNALLTAGLNAASAQALSEGKPDLTPGDAWHAASADHPVGQMPDLDTVANLVVHLLSDDPNFITGATFTFDGGMFAVV